jgi:hypothetical protein
MSQRKVYVALLDEGTDVWRPVDAEHVREDEYLLCGPIPEGEVWEFQPGDVVHCRKRTLSNGSTELVAFSRAQHDA